MLAAVPFRPDPPAAADRFDWPDEFGTRFGIVVDTEEEFDWSAPLSRDQRGVEAIAALPEAHRFFADNGVPLTYVVDHPVATTRSSVAVLRRLIEDGVTGIGTHLHPWVNPPFDETVTPANSFAGNLPRALEAAKLERLGEAIRTAFGVTPRLYRAGRYGLGPNTLALLAERGYAIDSSMRAGYEYRGENGPDYREIGNDPFRAGPGGALVELPLTTVHVGAARRGGAGLYDRLGHVPRGRGIAARMGLIDRISLTPEGMPVSAALRAIDTALDDGLRYLNFSFHSPTVQPGRTPYVRDADDLRDFYRWWRAVLALLERRGVRPASHNDLLAATRPHPLGDVALGACSSTVRAGRS